MPQNNLPVQTINFYRLLLRCSGTTGTGGAISSGGKTNRTGSARDLSINTGDDPVGDPLEILLP